MNTCFGPADILLPRDGETAALWPVVACDQFTSQREYWEKAAALVGDGGVRGVARDELDGDLQRRGAF